MSAAGRLRSALARPGAPVAVAAVLVVAKLWLVQAVEVHGIGSAWHDDLLFVRHAAWVLDGGWFGRYDQHSLAKGPFYTLFILANFLTGLPLLFTQALLYALASAVFVWALVPVVGRRWPATAIFAAILWNPATFAEQPATRVIREGIYPALSLLAVGCAAGFVLRVRSDRARGWAAAAGLALSAVWLTREERPWILPSLALLALVPLSGVRMPGLARRYASGLLVGALLFGGPVLAICVRNQNRYGAFAVTEFTEGPFPAAYGALQRVLPERPRRFVPVPRDAREKLYAASPAFAALKPHLEGFLLQAWSRSSCDAVQVCDDIAGGWFMWAVRDAARDAGKMATGREAAAYWREVARQVNGACDDGRLNCGPPRSGLAPPLGRSDLVPIISAARRGAEMLVRFEGMTPRPAPSEGDEKWLRVTAEMTRDRLAGGPREPRETRVGEWKLRGLESVVRVYGSLFPLAALAALVSWLACGLRGVRRSDLRKPFLISAALLAGVCARIAILALIDATSFPAVNVLYLSAAYPLFIAFVAVAIATPAGFSPPGQVD
jgi:hypothetical protein